MEKRFFIGENGQAVAVEDLDLLGDTSALADDRVFAELLRMHPLDDDETIDRGVIVPGFGRDENLSLADTGQEIVRPGSGGVSTTDFRAVVGGSIEAYLADTSRGVRSALVRSSVVELAPNDSGDNRIDLIYVALSVDVDGPNVERLVKNPSSLQITPSLVPAYKQTTAALGVVTGTPGSTPAYPDAPTDSSGTFYIPLAYVRVPDGFDDLSMVAYSDILHAAPVIRLASTNGVATLEPANSHYAGSQGRPANFGNAGLSAHYMSPTLIGTRSLMFTTDFGVTDGLSTGHLIDSRLWFGRGCKVEAYFSNGSGAVGESSRFVWLTSLADFDLVNVNNTSMPVIAGGSTVRVHADLTTDALIKLLWTGSPAARMTLILTFTPPIG